MNWHNYKMAKLHYEDLLREAEQYRLFRQIDVRQRTAAFYAPALAQLGRWLIAWGWRLRARYGEIEFAVMSDELSIMSDKVR